MAKPPKNPEGEAIGNQDPNRRGRGPKDAIGQKIPKHVKDQIKPPKQE